MVATLELVRIARDMQACGDTAAAEQVLAEVAPDFEYVRMTWRECQRREWRGRDPAVAWQAWRSATALSTFAERAEMWLRLVPRTMYLNPETYARLERQLRPRRAGVSGQLSRVLAEALP